MADISMEKKAGYIAVTEDDKALYYSSPEYKKINNQVNSNILKQAFKGEVSDEQVKFPKELGAEHPFNFEKVQEVCENMGIANAGVNKITDSIIGDFTIKADDANVEALLVSFVEESNFLSAIRPWVQEAVCKGNGYMDLTDLKNSNMRVLNANNMYIKRDSKGTVKEYNQFIGKLSSLKSYKAKINKFAPNEVAHLAINRVPGNAYGSGYIWSNLKTLEHYASSEIDRVKLIARKAGAPMHVKVGIPGETTNPDDVDAVKTSLQYMNNRTEWATDANVDIKVLDFKDLGKNLTEAANHDVEQFAIGMQIPMVLLGVANIPEGLAEVQLEAYQRFISSIRVLIEDVIESRILRPMLKEQGMDSKVQFLWSLPGEKEKNDRLTVLQLALSNMMLSPELRAALEIEYAEILGLEEVVNTLPQPAEARKRADEVNREKEETEIKQPEVPGAKPTANQSAVNPLNEVSGAIDEEIEIRRDEQLVEETPEFIEAEVKVKEVIQDIQNAPTEEMLIDMPISEYVNITEIPGFNYSDYLVKILQRLRVEKFSDLLALTEGQIDEGLLPQKDIDKLRVILKNGFRKNKTIRQIEKDINASIDLRDRIRFEEDGTKTLTMSAEKRPVMIARTETVRLANAGLKELYIENNLKQYRYLAALDDRTSDICQSLNGQMFLLSEGTPGVNMPPMHANCRSTIIPIIEESP